MERIFTKKKERLLTALLSLFCICAHLDANAQGWTGLSPSEASDNGTKVLLYNVGAQMFVCGDNIWDTQASFNTQGIYFALINKGVNDFSIDNSIEGKDDKRFIGWGSYGSEMEQLFIDLTTSKYIGGSISMTEAQRFTIEAVEGSSPVVYTIKGVKYNNTSYPTYYLTANNGSNVVGFTDEVPADDDKNAHWMFIPASEVKDYFASVANATVLYAGSADATSLISDYRFSNHNNDIKHWKTYNDEENEEQIQEPDEGGTTTYTLSEQKDNTLILGNGYSGKTVYSDIFADDKDLIKKYNGGREPADDAKVDIYLGGLWTINIKGSQTLTQPVTVTASGWYTITCKGFTTGSAVVYAKTESENTAFPSDAKEDFVVYNKGTAPTTYALAGDLLKNSTEGYNNSVSIYVDLKGAKEATIELGVTGTEGWTCIKEFHMTYYGEDHEPYFYFNDNNSDINQIKGQATSLKHSLYLHREFKGDVWSSLVLPVSVDAGMVKAAFGSNTVLSTLVGVNKDNDHLIDFAKVNLTDDRTVAIKAGVPYIIKPSKLDEVPGDIVFDKMANKDDKNVIVTENGEVIKEKFQPAEKDWNRPIVVIRNVTFSTYEKGLIPDDGMVEQTEDADRKPIYYGPCLDGLAFKGSYVRKGYEAGDGDVNIPAGSFLLGGSGSQLGLWYHTTKPITQIKGFRAWLDTSKVAGEQTVAIAINGVVDNGTVTAIDGVELNAMDRNASQNVYDINGRVVSTNGNTDKLMKGVYIMNGKKLLVK